VRAAPTEADLTLHVDLEARLHEREEAGAHPGPHRAAEHGVEDGVDEELAGCEGHALIDQEHLVLEEGPLVPSVRRLVAVHPPGVDEPQW
jgi:hypothetical protein